MKNQTTVRTIDDLGRIVIPQDIREAQGWDAGTKIEITICEADSITMGRPYCTQCRPNPESTADGDEA